MKKIGTILCLLLLTFLLEGCRMVKIKEADREPLKYTVVEKQQLPEEAAALIEEKKEKESAQFVGRSVYADCSGGCRCCSCSMADSRCISF